MENYFADCMTQDALRQKYRELCVKMHPDKNADDPDATAKFQEMQQQYEERKAELNGDYTAARKGRERREREEKERAERERQEREQRKVDQVIAQARQNRSKSYREWNTGDYVYAAMVNNTDDYWLAMVNVEGLLRAVLNEGVKDDCVVVIETIVELTDQEILKDRIRNYMPTGVWGGWEILQTVADATGTKKSKRVPKVIMFRSKNYCFLGNPMGDSLISTYYMPGAERWRDIFWNQLYDIGEKIRCEKEEQERLEAERKAKLLAEQQPLLEEWGSKLVEMSHGLLPKERIEVAVSNLKTMLKTKFPGTAFRVTTNKFTTPMYSIRWEDGPTIEEVEQVTRLFDNHGQPSTEMTPWIERFGRVKILATDRTISAVAKARILQQLGQVTMAFRECGILDDVKLTDFDWIMLHAMVGVDVNNADAPKCMSTLHADGIRTVCVASAVSYIFKHTSYKKATKKKVA